MYAPVAELEPDQLYAYLQARHGYSRELVHWKYLSPGGPAGMRGYAWVREGEIAGFLGLLPMQIRSGDTTVPASWSCDWSLADPKATPGMGIMLLKRTIRKTGLLVGLGGNANTHQSVPRMANHTVPERAARFVTVFRAGAGLAPLGARTGLEPLTRLLGRVPVRLARQPDAASTITEGVDAAIAPMLAELAARPGWKVAYDLAYLRWLLEECPAVHAFTARVGRAFVLAWHPTGDVTQWRSALWRLDGGTEDALPAMRAAHHEMMKRGAHKVQTLAGLDDPAHLQLLGGLGYVRRGVVVPLYFFSAPKVAWPSYTLKDPRLVDTDHVHLF